MNAYEALVTDWEQDSRPLHSSKPFQLVAAGRLTSRQYAALLRQVFHHARENPQIQALATARFRGEQRELVRPFLRHASSEIGHDELALRDIQALGENVDAIRRERPLPATFALLASVFHMIEHHDAVAYLGYLFQLEFTPIRVGESFMTGLERCGIPRTAMSFIAEHSTVDVGHCKLMEQYCSKLIRTRAELDSVLYMRSLTAELYREMLERALESAACWDGLTSSCPKERWSQDPGSLLRRPA